MDKIVNKPWGHETIFCVTDKYVGKYLVVKGGQRLSYQYHQKKQETMRLLSGSCDLVVDDKAVQMEIGQSIDILPLVKHRLIARTDSTILEISTPELDDVVRLDDDYGRTPNESLVIQRKESKVASLGMNY